MGVWNIERNSKEALVHALHTVLDTHINGVDVQQFAVFNIVFICNQ